ncbi:MAG TPA: class II aldolase/adducin family protein [Thermomicrobiaceae bacterium]|nr:class II aldolase/adducin family protein [Thermomicrobiaceae bacterium]
MATTSTAQEVDAVKQSIINASRQLVQSGVLSRSQHGNISARLPDGDHFVLTGGGTLEALSAGDLAVLDLQGNVVEGYMSPMSAEIIQMHAAVYRKRDDVGSVIHTHSPYVTAFAIAGKEIPTAYEAMVRFDFTEPVPVAKYGPRGSEKSINNIVDVVGPNTKAVLLENHGLLAFDSDIEKTVRGIMVLEESAEIILLADELGGAKPIPPEMVHATNERRDQFGGRR